MKPGDPFLLDGNFGIILSLVGNHVFVLLQNGTYGYVRNEVVKQGKVALEPLEVAID